MDSNTKSIKLALLEATLFTTDEPLSMEELIKILKIRRESIEKLMNELREKYSKPDSGVSVSEIGGFRLVVKQEFAEKVSHLTPHADLSRGLLRVLAIIAYHEPIKQADIVKVVGNRTYDYVKELEERRLVKCEKKSRTKIIMLTPQFEQYFGVSKDELKEKFKEEKEIADNEQKDDKEV